MSNCMLNIIVFELQLTRKCAAILFLMKIFTFCKKDSFPLKAPYLLEVIDVAHSSYSVWKTMKINEISHIPHDFCIWALELALKQWKNGTFSKHAMLLSKNCQIMWAPYIHYIDIS